MRNQVRTRAWSKKENKFVYDFVIDSVGNHFQSDGCEYWKDERDLVIVQSTGRKDKNGNEIFEGDIIKEMIENEFGSMSEGEGIVNWCEHHAGYELRTKNYDPVIGAHTIGTNCEIIGNIFERLN